METSRAKQTKKLISKWYRGEGVNEQYTWLPMLEFVLINPNKNLVP